MNDTIENASGEPSHEPAAPTQVELYDDLRRIGELEDQKQAIQREIEERTQRLRDGMSSLDSESLLRQMLTAALVPTAEKTSRKASARKSTKRKTIRRKKKK